MLRDSFGRVIDYVRVSVTDRCNLRCSYCLPASYGGFAAAGDVLSAAELERLARVLADLGVRRLRLTGGEPLVRSDIVDVAARLARLPGVSDLSLSTNGLRLAALAAPLARAGLDRVNVSLDSLDAGRYRAITRHGALADVLAGIEAALAAGLAPVKLNVVVARGMNDGELADFAALTAARPLHVRFIELMPMGETGFFCEERRVPLDRMLELAGPLEALPVKERPQGAGPARVYRRPGGRGTIGFISALSCGFCASCNRMRLSSTGRLILCLDGEDGVDLLTPLRAGASDEALSALVMEAVRAKPERHRMNERAGREGGRLMCSVGG